MIGTDQIRDYLIKAFTTESARDRQVKIGPSELGGCPFCVGYTMARKFFDLPPREGSGFGYGAKIGTMLHDWMERNFPLPDGSLREQKLETVTVDGYGLITGHADVIVPEWGAVLDWKWPGKFSYDKYALAHRTGGQLPNNYRYQAQLYVYGARKLGLDIGQSLVCIFPRHTNDVQDLLVWDLPYSEEMVLLVKARAEAILEDILEGRLGDIPSEQDCYQCDKHGRPSVAGYMDLKINEH